MSAAPRRFAQTGRLPDGPLLLEASAGTGKTYSITSLVLRLVVEDGVPLDRILVVTFTRAAAAELRSRVRARLTAAARAFEAALVTPAEGATDGPGAADGPGAGGATADGTVVDGDVAADGGAAAGDVAGEQDDEVVAHLVGVAVAAGPRRVEGDLDRLRRAVERFDEATIDTIHGFCHRALRLVASDLGVDTDAQLADDVDDLLDELVNDALVRELRDAPAPAYDLLRGARFDQASLRAIARRLEAEPGLRILPPLDAGAPGEVGADAVADVERRLRDFIAAWQRDGAELATWLAAHASGFRGSYYNRSRPAREAAAIAAWCAQPDLGRGWLDAIEARLRYVCRSEMVERLLDPAALPDHLGVIDAADALLAAGADLATAARQRFAARIGDELTRRKAARGILSFSDLLVALDDALADEPVRDRVRATIRDRFEVALIDEFQDTDPTQWRIFRALFGDARGLRLVGDPKQAIYAFRGADVDTYLVAAASVPPSSRFTLTTSYRADQRYLDALDALFGRAAFGPDGVFGVAGISHVALDTPPAHREDRLRFADGPRPALVVRFVRRSLATSGEEPPPDVIPGTWGQVWLPAVVATEIVELLDEQPEIVAPDGSSRPVEPSDIAVLVRTNPQARAVQAALLGAGVPAVVGSDASVFGSDDAMAVQRLLDAMLRPSATGVVRAALAGPILGRDATELAAADDDVWDGWLADLERWAARWRRHGVAAALREAMTDAGTVPHLLAQPRGERRLTNLRHLVELLHRAQTTGRLAPEELARWLRDRRHDDDLAPDDLQLRLESDADAVTVVTVHRAKGLQYPIVWCPFLWQDPDLHPDDLAALRFHDPGDGSLALDVDARRDGARRRRHEEQAMHERWSESLRLAYVALTRAQHRCVVHTGVFRDVGRSPLQRLLHAAGVEPDDPLEDPRDRGDDELLDELRDIAPGVVGVAEVPSVGTVPAWRPPARPQGPLTVRRLTRGLDRVWQRTSFSRLAAEAERSRAHVVDAVPMAEEDGAAAALLDHDTEVEATVEDRGVASTEENRPVTLADFPRGAEPGTFLHDVFEHLDFALADDAAAIDEVVAARLARARLPGVDRAVVVLGLSEVLRTPLGPQVADRALCTVARADRLDELAFDLPLGGGYQADGEPISLHRVADVLDAHASAGSAPLAAYVRRLRDRPAPPARGFLTGSIDLVARIDGRYLVADYKSNWLGRRDGDRWRSTAADYHPDRLATQMVDHDYVLQYHLYVVALHRFLRWRLGAAYDYDRHVAGVAYLFLRGMTGPDVARTTDGAPYGIYLDRPSRALVEDLDALLHGVTPVVPA